MSAYITQIRSDEETVRVYEYSGGPWLADFMYLGEDHNGRDEDMGIDDAHTENPLGALRNAHLFISAHRATKEIVK